MNVDNLDVYRVFYDTDTSGNFNEGLTGYSLTETSMFQLDSLNNGNNFFNIYGPVQYYYQDPSVTGSLCMYPIPNTVNSLGTIYYIYYRQANLLSNSSDTPFQGIDRFQDYSDLLIYYTAGVVYAIEGEDNKSNTYFALYSTRSEALAKEISNHPNFVPGMAGPAQSR